MALLQAPQGQPIVVGRAGPTLTVINAASLIAPYLGRDSGPSVTTNRVAAYDVLIGFDRTPSATDYDAIAPAYSIANIHVPSDVRQVTFLFPAGTILDAAAHTVRRAEGTPLLVSWSGCSVPTSITPLTPSLPLEAGASKLAHFLDGLAAIWPPAMQTPVLDSAYGSRKPSWIRPHIAPSMVDTIHAVTAANTLFAFTGPQAWLAGWVGSKLVFGIDLSVSADTLVVIGDDSLTVGSPGAGEVWRGFVKAAGQPVSIRFGEGLEVDRGNSGAAWKAYTAAIVTLEATVIGG